MKRVFVREECSIPTVGDAQMVPSNSPMEWAVKESFKTFKRLIIDYFSK